MVRLDAASVKEAASMQIEMHIIHNRVEQSSN